MRSEQYSQARDFRKYSILTFLFIVAFSISTLGQSGGSTSSQKQSSSDKADQNLRSLAHVNPSSLAMELSIPLMTYPGRNGHSVPIVFNYSSKVWQMDNFWSWTYRVPGAPPPPTQSGVIDTYLRYMSDLNPEYAKFSNAGWTTNLAPPVIEERDHVFTTTGALYPFATTQDGLAALYDHIFNNNTGLTEAEIDDEEPCGERVCELVVPTCPWGLPCYSWECRDWGYNPCPDDYPHQPTTGPVPQQAPQPAPIGHTIAITRTFVRTSDGASHEFRKGDSISGYCNGSQNDAPTCSGNGPDKIGTFLSVDSSGMKLVRTLQGSTLYMPDGGRYLFPSAHQHTGESSFLFYATEFQDVNGNKISYSEEEANYRTFVKQTDTLGRQIVDPLPQNFGVDFQIPRHDAISLAGFDGTNQEYSADWLPLKPIGCETETNASCGDGNDQDAIGDGALEDQSQKLYYTVSQYCNSFTSTSLLTNPNDPADPSNEVLFPEVEEGLRPCNPISIQGSTATPVRSNPVVLAAINLPNGKSYVFKYNRYGEISKIIYPTGSYETFQYAKVKPLSPTYKKTYDQTNRGVVEHRVYDVNNVLQQRWRYSGEPSTGFLTTYRVTTIAPKGNDPMGDGVRTERNLYAGLSAGTLFGLEDPRIGMSFEEKTFDENGILRSRTLNEWIVKRPPIGGTELYNAFRDPRLKHSATIIFEPGSSAALATMQETDYDDTGSSDPQFFSHLNVKRKKAYHYALISDKTTVDNETLAWETIETWFPSSKLASISETDYSYSTVYKDRGIIGLVTESRALNPTNTSDVLSKSQAVYDEGGVYFIDEGTTTGYATPTGANTHLRGNVTTSRTWVKETDTWLQTHAAYDNFGNVRKVWDAAGDNDPNKFVETQYSSTYNFAYRTKVISPAPAGSSNNHVTTETSSVETTYDPNTGLVLTVKNDFGQITKTEYNDPLLRPTKVLGDNFTAPISETIYDDNALTVKVRKQIDETNWDEATTYSNSLGQTIKTVAKDSQGDVIAESHYDLLGRVDRVTNPYRAGDTVYWNKTRYDEVGRAVETYAPATFANLGSASSLGETSFGFSTVTNYFGKFVTTTDASGRKGRSITNALGQLLRVDEPTAVGGTADADLGAIGSPAQPTYYTYDLYGNLVKVVQGAVNGQPGQKRYFKYDSLGRLIRVNQPEQEANPALATTGNPDNNSWTAGFTYDALGNVLTATDAKGVTISNTYDRAGRVTSRGYFNETGVTTPTVYFFYDGKGLDTEQTPINFGKGKLTKVTNTVSETRYKVFDNFGRLKEMEQRTPANDTETISTATPRVSKYTYNFAGALIEEEYPSGRKVKNEYEVDGDLKRVYGKANSTSAEQTYVNSFSYTAAGGIGRMRLGNGRWETAQFSNRNQVTQLGLGNSATDASLWKTNYYYGEFNPSDGSVETSKSTSNIAKQTLTIPGATYNQGYQYDGVYRLTNAKEWTGTNLSSPNWTQTFGYDVYGNRTSFAQNIGGTTTNTTPAVSASTNRLSSGFTYDKNGNITADVDPVTSQARTFVFNGDNKQVEVKNASGLPIGKYYYDGEGRRVKKVTNTETTLFVYSGGKLAEEYSTQVSQAPTISYTTTDHLDSPRVITDKFGAIKSRRDFMPFGEDIFVGVGGRTGETGQKYASTQDDIRQKFTGYQKDRETSLDFAEARMYENRFGRFTAVDPLIASGRSANPQTFNRYVYVGNNPLFFVDPTGLIWGTAKDGRVRWFDKKLGKGFVEFRPENWQYVGTDGNVIELDPNSSKWHEIKPVQVFGEDNPIQTLATSVSDTVDSSLNGAAKGGGNFVVNTWNGLTQPLGPAGGYFGVPNPLGLKPWTYNNATEAKFGTATSTGLSLAPLFVTGHFSASTSSSVVPASETYFRTMTPEAAEQFLATGVMPAGTETMVTKSLAEAQNYRGVTMQIEVRVGTTSKLESIGVRNSATAHPYPQMPTVQSGWMKSSAYFKYEKPHLNVGLGNGRALDTFNCNIITCSIVP